MANEWIYSFCNQPGMILEQKNMIQRNNKIGENLDL